MNKFITYTLIGISAVGLAGAGVAYAAEPANASRGIETGLGRGHGYEQMLATKAEILGLSADELRTKLASGQTFLGIAEERGLTQDELHEAMQTAQRDRMQQMVTDGRMTQEQADARLERMTERQATCTGEGMMGAGMGMGMGRALGSGPNNR